MSVESNVYLFPPALISALEEAREIAVLTGAGVSAESGIPTFREAQRGLWARFQPEELATPQAFLDNPRRVLAWYRWRKGLVDQANPNPAHRALASLERRCQENQQYFLLITQNVDNLHHRAGNQQVIKLHGSLTDLKCFQCGTPSRFNLSSWQEEDDLPRCTDCGGLLRPDVVWFGESLDVESLEKAAQAANDAQVFFSIGTAAVVHPAASLPLQAKHGGAVVIEINPDQTPVTKTADFAFHHPAGKVLPALINKLQG